jgi:hypothetical protein
MPAEGPWQVALDAERTGLLPGGTNRLEIVAISEWVAIPVFGSETFALPREIFPSVIARP